MFKKKLGFLLGVMVFLSLAGYLICLMAGGKEQWNKDKEFLLVTSFYPMYVLAENLTEGVEGVTVSNLTENQTGCLHDYVISPRDMRLLDKADAFLINGAGMELFLEKVMENNSGLPIIEAAHGISLLGSVAHNHDHGIEQETEHDEADHDEHSHAENGHVWMDVERYRAQLITVKEELLRLLPEEKEALEAAASVYDAKLQAVAHNVADLRKDTEGIPVVIFHEAFAYLAESLGMEILGAFSLDENTLPSHGEIVEVIEEIKYHGGAIIFIEQENAKYANGILAETNASVVYINPLTIGDGSSDSYEKEMQNNLDAIQEAVNQ